jgi:hypothetical protein
MQSPVVNETKSTIFVHPTYKRYGCNESGKVFNLHLDRELSTAPAATKVKKADNTPALVTRILIRHEKKGVGISLPRFLYECYHNRLLQKSERIYRKDKSFTNNTKDNLILKKPADATVEQIDKKIAKLMARKGQVVEQVC